MLFIEQGKDIGDKLIEQMGLWPERFWELLPYIIGLQAGVCEDILRGMRKYLT
jgi:hypothetical protein